MSMLMLLCIRQKNIILIKYKKRGGDGVQRGDVL